MDTFRIGEYTQDNFESQMNSLLFSCRYLKFEQFQETKNYTYSIFNHSVHQIS